MVCCCRGYKLDHYEPKVYALYHTRFQQVLMSDADNIALREPSHLFDSPQMKLHGNLFWQVGKAGKPGGRGKGAGEGVEGRAGEGGWEGGRREEGTLGGEASSGRWANLGGGDGRRPGGREGGGG